MELTTFDATGGSPRLYLSSILGFPCKMLASQGPDHADKVPVRDREAAKARSQTHLLGEESDAGSPSGGAFRSAVGRALPSAHAMSNDIDMLNHSTMTGPEWRRMNRATDTIERRFREVRRKHRSMWGTSTWRRVMWSSFAWVPSPVRRIASWPRRGGSKSAETIAWLPDSLLELLADLVQERAQPGEILRELDDSPSTPSWDSSDPQD